MNPRPPYRTVGIAALGILALGLGLLIVGHWPAAAGSYPAFCGGVGACVGSVALKAWGEHKALAEAGPQPSPAP